MVLKQLLFQNITKNRLVAGGFAPRPHSLRRLGTPLSDPVCNTFDLQYTFLLKHVSQFKHFRIFAIGLSPLLEQVPTYVPAPVHGF